ncbi:MAG: hypothetical protein AB8B79_05905 [Granulosicoccus sp.]
MTKDISQQKSSGAIERIGSAQRTARRLTLASTLADHRDKWALLDDTTQRRLEWLNFYIPVVLALGALLLLLMMISNLGGTTIHVTASTEHVRYTPLVSDPPLWPLKGATISVVETDVNNFDDSLFVTSPPAEIPDRADTGYDGYFQPHCGDTITVSRTGAAELTVFVESSQQALITPASNNTGKIVPLDGVRSFHISLNAESLSGDEAALVWPMAGRIDPSRAIKVQHERQYGVLLSGNVEVLAGRFFSNSRFLIDKHLLEPGDHLVLPTSAELNKKASEISAEIEKAINTGASEEEAFKKVDGLCRRFELSNSGGLNFGVEKLDKGFILAGGSPRPGAPKALHVSLSSNASHAEIERYRTANLRVSSSWTKRLLNDPIIPLGFTVVGFGFVFNRKLIRLLVVLAIESANHTETEYAGQNPKPDDSKSETETS